MIDYQAEVECELYLREMKRANARVATVAARRREKRAARFAEYRRKSIHGQRGQ